MMVVRLRLRVGGLRRALCRVGRTKLGRLDTRRKMLPAFIPGIVFWYGIGLQINARMLQEENRGSQYYHCIMTNSDFNFREALISANMGRHIDRNVNEKDEARAQGQIAGLLNGWRHAMSGRTGIMSRNDGSDLRRDELRVPELSEDRRSSRTRDYPPEHVTAPSRADHAIGVYHNLMIAFDSMVMNESRDALRLHLTAEFVMIRALLETATTALWILGPDDSDTRVTRALRLRYDELKHSNNLAKNFANYSGDLEAEDYLTQKAFVDGQIEDLKVLAADMSVSVSRVTKDLTPSTIASEAGVYVPGLGGPLTYWFWSTASSLAHGEPANMRLLSDIKLIGVDVRDNLVGHVEPSAANIFLHLKASHDLISKAHELWNRRAKP
jgi:hypothetical protein